MKKRLGRPTNVRAGALSGGSSRQAGASRAPRNQRPVELLTPLIACATGPSRLSQTYKRSLTRSLSRKHR
jgi:hypothetical protein